MDTVIQLNDEQLAGLGISNADIIDAIEQTLVDIRHGRVTVAPKTAAVAPDGRYIMATLAASDGTGLIAVKSVMVNERNKQRGLPGINGGILLLDSETGLIKALLGANWITAVRTAGLSAVAAKRLANSNSGTLALIGTGVQAISHLQMFAELFPLRTVWAFGRGEAGIRRVGDAAEALGLTFTTGKPRECLEAADIVVSTVTLDYTIEPFLDARWLHPGAFATITDLAIPWQAEGQSAFDRIYIDDLNQERAMEKPMVRTEQITGELADLVVGEVSWDARQSSAFVFRGIAAGDLAVAALAYHRAVA